MIPATGASARNGRLLGRVEVQASLLKYYHDAGNFNDRLLLGLKGTMSEAELHILKGRMLEGRRAKARRGELGKTLPMGYLRRPSGEITLDPDEQAQGTIRLVFELSIGWYRWQGDALSR